MILRKGGIACSKPHIVVLARSLGMRLAQLHQSRFAYLEHLAAGGAALHCLRHLTDSTTLLGPKFDRTPTTQTFLAPFPAAYGVAWAEGQVGR